MIDPWEDPERYKPGFLHGRVHDGELRLSVQENDWAPGEIAKYLIPGSCQLTAIPKPTKDGTGELKAPLTWAVVTQCARIAEVYRFRWKPDESLNAWIVAEFGRRFAEYGDGDLKFDTTALERTPMPHQLSGAFMTALNRRVLLADDMGTGKTFTALLALAEMEARGLDPFPAFVVTPASVTDPWLEEMEACFPDWTFTAYRGPNRKKLSSRYQVYVMSWDTFRTDMYPRAKATCEDEHYVIEWKSADQKRLDKYLLGETDAEPKLCADCGKVMLPFDVDKKELPPLIEFNVPRTVILDECHALCNAKTKQSVAARRVARVAEYVILLSGTPITSDIGGFWSALNVIDTRSFPDQERYKMRYTDRYKKDYGQEEITGLTSVNREEFHTLMQGTMRRVSKRDVLKDLPDKTYNVRYVDIPPAHRAAYDEMEEDMLAHIPDTDEPLPAMNTLAQLTRLSQLASSACDVEIEMTLDESPGSLTYGEEVPHYKVTQREPSWKIDELMQLMSEAEGQPVVCFDPHVQLMNLAGSRAEKHGYKVGYIKGGQSHGARTAVRTAFQEGQLDLLCVTVAAGGVGLTLTASRIAVFLSRPWSFVQSAQAEDRLHRRGQAGAVTVVDIIARNTVESRVRKAIRDKAKNLSELVREPAIFREVLGGTE